MRVGLEEVFPLQDGIGEDAHHGVDESIDEVLILAPRIRRCRRPR